VRAGWPEAAVTPRIVHRANDWDAVIALVASGAGVALVPSRSARDEPARSTYAAVRSGSQSAPHIAAVLDVLRAVAAGPSAQMNGCQAHSNQ
jgi:DNA-binding transcriptional LysR family regulator